MSCILEPAFQSGDNGQRISLLTAVNSPLQKIPYHTIMLFVCSQEKRKTMLMQNFGVTNKEHYRNLRYFL